MMVKRTKAYYDNILKKYELTRKDMPKCYKCKTKKRVVAIGTDYFGFEFRCTKCRNQWAQEL